jgi:hypothetical protein
MADTLLDLTNEKELFGKRSLRSYIRQAFGAVSELPIFENKYYDLFKTPLDTFQERFHEGGEFGWRSDTEDWTEATTSTLYDLWRKTGAPALEDRPYKRSMTAPREMAFADRPNELQKLLGYLLGTPRMILGTESPGMMRMGGADPAHFVAELAHQVMFEQPEKYGQTRKSLIDLMLSQGGKGYDEPGTIEYVTHKTIEPQILDYLRSVSK